MRSMVVGSVKRILAPGEAPPVAIVGGEGRAPLCLVCEHASPAIPATLGDLGLAPADRLSHAVWDPGAEALARALSAALDAPLVLGTVSRLVFDCNRPPGAPDAIPARSETIEVPGNRDLPDDVRDGRAAEVYVPFHARLTQVLHGFAALPALVTVHSFAPVWHGIAREVELGLLHDADDRLARRLLDLAPPETDARLNQPYSAADGVTHTLARHATAGGLPSAMIEVRNDLLASDAGVARMAAILIPMLTAALAEVRA